MTLMKIVSRSSAAALLLGAGAASAHPGHDAAAHAMGFWQGLVHLLSEPDHLLLLGGGVALAVVVVRRLRRAAAARRAGAAS